MLSIQQILDQARGDVLRSKLKEIEKPTADMLDGIDPVEFTKHMMIVIERTIAYAFSAKGPTSELGFSTALILETFKAQGFFLKDSTSLEEWLQQTYNCKLAEEGMLKWFLKFNGLSYTTFKIQDKIQRSALVGPTLYTEYDTIMKSGSIPSYPDFLKLKPYFENDK